MGFWGELNGIRAGVERHAERVLVRISGKVAGSDVGACRICVGPKSKSCVTFRMTGRGVDIFEPARDFGCLALVAKVCLSPDLWGPGLRLRFVGVQDLSPEIRGCPGFAGVRDLASILWVFRIDPFRIDPPKFACRWIYGVLD